LSSNPVRWGEQRVRLALVFGKSSQKRIGLKRPLVARGRIGPQGTTDGEGVTEPSTQASSRLSGDGGVALLPPQLEELSAEQLAEAVALLSDLLLAAPRGVGDGRDPPAVEGELRAEGLAA
jgi:hypothetical protein